MAIDHLSSPSAKPYEKWDNVAGEISWSANRARVLAAIESELRRIGEVDSDDFTQGEQAGLRFAHAAICRIWPAGPMLQFHWEAMQDVSNCYEVKTGRLVGQVEEVGAFGEPTHYDAATTFGKPFTHLGSFRTRDQAKSAVEKFVAGKG